MQGNVYIDDITRICIIHSLANNTTKEAVVVAQLAECSLQTPEVTSRSFSSTYIGYGMYVDDVYIGDIIGKLVMS